MPTANPTERKADDSEPFSALIFKIMADPFVGSLSFIRVYSGVLAAGAGVYNSTKNRRERIGRLLQMHANKREEIEEIRTGDIGAAVGFKDVYTGETICDENHPVILESMDFPDPVIQVAIEPKTKADQEKMGIALQKLAQEDPTFKVHTDPETGQTIIAGMGELHLEIIVDRMLREFKVDANVGKPQVAYRETIRKKVDSEGKFVRQSGGRGQYGHVKITVEPNETGKGYEFINDIVGGVHSQGIHQAHRPGHPGGPDLRRARRATPWWTSRSPSSTAATTRWTPTKWRSRSPAPWPSRPAARRPVPCSSSPSWPSRSRFPRTTWAT